MAIVGAYPYILLNGQVADATQVMADFNLVKSDVNTHAATNGANSDITSLTGLTTPLSVAQGGTGGTVFPFPPVGGRLTLTTGMPFSGDVSGATTVYWTPYVNAVYPWFNGVLWTVRAIGELSLALDSNSGHTGYQQSGKNFDLFVYNDSGTDRLVTGPAWTSGVARSAAVAFVNGILVNSLSMVAKFDSSSSTKTVGANQGTYVGTMRAIADGQTSVVTNPTPASGGAPAIIGLWNAYNRVGAQALVIDSGVGYTYTSSTIRQARASTGNQISFISGFAYEAGFATYSQRVDTVAAGAAFAEFGIGLDDTTAFTYGPTLVYSTSTNGNIAISTSVALIAPQIGWHVISANEQSDNTNANTFGAQEVGTLQAQLRI